MMPDEPYITDDVVGRIFASAEAMFGAIDAAAERREAEKARQREARRNDPAVKAARTRAGKLGWETRRAREAAACEAEAARFCQERGHAGFDGMCDEPGHDGTGDEVYCHLVDTPHPVHMSCSGHEWMDDEQAAAANAEHPKVSTDTQKGGAHRV